MTHLGIGVLAITPFYRECVVHTFTGGVYTPIFFHFRKQLLGDKAKHRLLLCFMYELESYLYNYIII